MIGSMFVYAMNIFFIITRISLTINVILSIKKAKIVIPH